MNHLSKNNNGDHTQVSFARCLLSQRVLYAGKFTATLLISCFIFVNIAENAVESTCGAVVRPLTPPPPPSPPMWPGFMSRLDVVCGLSLLLVLSLAPRGFPPGTPVFPSQKPTLPNSHSIRNGRTRLNGFLITPRCFVGKQITVTMSCLLLCTF